MKVKEKVMEIVFLVAACVSILAVLLICVFLFSSGIPAIGKIGPLNFLGGTVWKPSNNLFGILPMILGSIYVTAGAIIIGVPIGIFMAVFMARFCPGSLYKILKPAVELLAGIPSIVYGFFGMEVLVPLLRNTFAAFNCKGNSMLAASILLGIMILPTLSVFLNPRFVQCRTVIMKDLWHWEQIMKEVYSLRCFRLLNPAFWLALFLVLDVRSVKQWRLSW